MKPINLVFVIADLVTANIHEQPILTELLSKAQLSQHSYSVIEVLIAHLSCLDKNDKTPIAAISALGSHLVKSQSEWLRADPVALKVDGAQVFMANERCPFLTLAEAKSLLKELNEFLIKDELEIFMATPNEWYLALPQAPEIVTYPPAQVIGKSIYDYLPQGKRGHYWRKLLTEIQMLLFHSAVNAQRSKQGLATVDSLWFWGEGQLPNQPIKSVWQGISTDQSFCAGLAKLEAQNNFILPSSFDDWYRTLTQPGNYLVVIDKLRLTDREEAYQQTLNELLQTWLIPAYGAIKKGTIHSLKLYPNTRDCYAFNRPWWRRISLG